MLNYIMSVAAILALLTGTAGAQQLSDLQQGARIRIHPITGKAQIGSFGGATSDTLLLRPATAGGAPTRVALAEVGEIEASQGRPRLKRALLIGLLGAGAGYALGSAVDGVHTAVGQVGCGMVLVLIGDPSSACSSIVEESNTGKYTGLLIGAAAGSLLGAVTAGERWRSVSPGR